MRGRSSECADTDFSDHVESTKAFFNGIALLWGARNLPDLRAGSIGGDPWPQSAEFFHVRDPACLRHKARLSFHALCDLFVGSHRANSLSQSAQLLELPQVYLDLAQYYQSYAHD